MRHTIGNELVNLVGNSEDELVTLENNEFHVENSRFLISIYSRDPLTNEYTLDEHHLQIQKQSQIKISSSKIWMEILI